MSWINSFLDADEKTIPAEIIRSRNPDRTTYTADELGLEADRKQTGPLVSVVVPTYRDSKYLPTALESISAQSYSNIELLVVDSSGEEWIEQLATDCTWIRYLDTEPEGVSAARNEGINRAAGEYVALLDTDDYWHPEKTEKQVAALERGVNSSFTCHYFVKFWNNDQPTVKLRDRQMTDPNTAYRDTLRQKLKPHTSTLMFRASAVPDRPFREDLQNFEDIVFAVELFKDNPPAHLSTPLSVRRLRDGSLTDRMDATDKIEFRIEAYDYLATAHPDLEKEATLMKAQMAYELGWEHLQKGRRSESRQCFRRSLQCSPRNPKAMALYGVSLLPIGGKKISDSTEYLYQSISRRLQSDTSASVGDDQYIDIESSD